MHRMNAVFGLLAIVVAGVLAPPSSEAGPPTEPFGFQVSLSPSASTIPAGTSAILTIALDKAAPAVVPVTLTRSGPAGVATCPSLVKIPAGKSKVSFSVRGARQGGPVTVTATLPASAGGASASSQVTVLGPSISLEPETLTVLSHGTGTLVVWISQVQLIDVTLTVSQSGPKGVVGLPTDVTIRATNGATTIEVKGLKVGGPVTVTASLPASLGGAHDSSQVSVIALQRPRVKRP